MEEQQVILKIGEKEYQCPTLQVEDSNAMVRSMDCACGCAGNAGAGSGSGLQ
ncbi:hypothetical protein [Paenibacillus sp. 1-18]|uniref:hypothetical protein n=1 Tax=Paenibacillus sp. 1-18 TaxID=1333846 RepID=UPI0012DDCC37|nr:hypothetical protein [Paenibacillus sp. 1-18]